MFLPVVNEGNRFVVLLVSINGDPGFAIVPILLQDSDVINGFPISLMHPDLLPVHGKAWSKTQLVRFQLQPEQ